MRAKTRVAVVTFHTTAEAMAMEGLCRERGIPGKLFSAPRSLSADCGIAWQSPMKEMETLKQALEEAGLEIHNMQEWEV